jgi:gliding motility-associated-like protein
MAIKGLLIIILGFFLAAPAHAQCSSPINSFPYLQDFELNDGGWVPENSLHWNYGSISGKPVISNAASGMRCWVAGSLSTNAYNAGVSALTSPCFDISSLSHPEVGFHIFWESERRFDGVSMQYSTNNGASWQVLGSINSNSNCEGENWFNQDPVNFLALPGWSGNVQPTSGSCQGGNGSGDWLNARHSLENLGATHIIFRFVFGAGTICNEYDGFAFDDFFIREAAPNAVDLFANCTGNLSASFNPSIQGCISSLTWNFGDPASGSANTSNQTNPSHQFSSGGEYLVTLSVDFNTGADMVDSLRITVLNIAGTVTQPLVCHGDHNGGISIAVDPAGTYSVLWNTSPPQTSYSISNLSAGTYTATVTGADVCASFITIPLNEPPALDAAINKRDAFCGNNNGRIEVQGSGGISPYQYQWTSGETSAVRTGLAPGAYQVNVSDANGCVYTSPSINISSIIRNIPVSLGKDTIICPGETLLLNPGPFTAYVWQDGSTAPFFKATESGNYKVTVTDSLGCRGTSDIDVLVDCPDIYFPSAFTPNGDALNNGFGPLGGIFLLREYSLNVYGRWGELIFSSGNPYEKWNGNYKSAQLPTGTYTWYATYRLRGTYFTKKGTVTIIR